ncbi:MAG TPA: hypothetical protein VKG22_08765 [Stellaceae bacterium]|nr:hypothetical protein [Stellaceae bacterium]
MRLVGLREIECQIEPATAGNGGIETNQDIAKRHFSSPCHGRRDTPGERSPENARRKAPVPQPRPVSANTGRRSVSKHLVLSVAQGPQGHVGSRLAEYRSDFELTGGAISDTRKGWTREIDATAAPEYDNDRDRDINAEGGDGRGRRRHWFACNPGGHPATGSKGVTVT